ncbi:hypothetical protein BOX15_Mlig022045g1 [Macrostomum lignano]|uniref:Uncharacterized protein n=1 Tax=Macrostomum lignano TaxID=282301 RepID=A0A267DGI6_9PLAT|nr:hypothetical protein BOX15_Mlig022045g1 [Macrostomum lignano]
MLSAAGVNSGAGRLRDCWYTSGGGAVRFYPMDPPTMSNRRSVRYLHKFRFGDTYQLKSRSWLLPQFLSGALTMCGVIFTLVGIICLQINKYLRRCDSDDAIHCKDNQAKINNVMMPIGVGSTGGGLTLILISGFIFVHAFCVIYDDTEHQVGPEFYTNWWNVKPVKQFFPSVSCVNCYGNAKHDLNWLLWLAEHYLNWLLWECQA